MKNKRIVNFIVGIEKKVVLVKFTHTQTIQSEDISFNW